MMEAELFLREHLPGTDDKKIDFLATKLVTREHFNEVKDDKKWITSVDEAFILHQQEKIVKLESALKTMKQSVETSAEKIVAGKQSFSKVGEMTGRKASIESDIEKKESEVERNIQEVEQAMSALDEQIESETSALRMLQTKYAASQKLIDDYKKKLKLPPDANHETVLTAIEGLKFDSTQLQQVESSLKFELEKSKNLQEDIKDKTTKIARLNSEVEKLNAVMQGLQLRHHPIPKVNLPYASDALQCKSCKNAIGLAVLFCDQCNLKRLQRR